MKLIKLFVLMVFCCSTCCFGQRIDSTALMNNLQTLASDQFEGRSPDQKGGKRSREFVRNQFIKIGLEPAGSDYFQSFLISDRDGNEYTGYNVMAQIDGSEDGVIIISSHHDHLGIKNDQIYNGADDNASGTCALFAIGEFFKANKPKHSMLLVAFDAEEWGLRGAKAFVENPPVELSTIDLNINLDMIGRNVNNEIYVTGTRYTPELKNLFDEIDTPLKVSFGHDGADEKQDWTFSSDHAPFHKEGIPFLYFGEEDHPDYHKPSDTFDGIMPSFYLNAVNLVIDTVISFDNQ